MGRKNNGVMRKGRFEIRISGVLAISGAKKSPETRFALRGFIRGFRL
jgi:hypothetical protein